MSAKGTRAVDVVTRAGVAFRVHEVPPDAPARGDRTLGEWIADALGVEPARVFKTLVARAGGAPVVAVVPVTGTLDLKALARAHGARRAELADPGDAERLTGYVLGGVSPLGQKRRLATYLDETAAGFATVFVSAGRRGLDLELAPADLLQVTGGRLAPLARD